MSDLIKNSEFMNFTTKSNGEWISKVLQKATLKKRITFGKISLQIEPLYIFLLKEAKEIFTSTIAMKKKANFYTGAHTEIELFMDRIFKKNFYGGYIFSICL